MISKAFQRILLIVFLSSSFSTSIQADDFTKALEDFKKMINDPESGYLAAQKAAHKSEVQTYLGLLAQDTYASAQLFIMGTQALIELDEHLKNEQIDIQKEFEKTKELTSANLMIAPLLQLSQRADRVSQDRKRIARWLASLEKDFGILIDTVKTPCSDQRLKTAKNFFNMKALFQRRGIQLDNFGKDAQSFVADVFSAPFNDLGIQAPMHGGYAFAVGANIDGAFSLNGKLPFLSQTDSEIASYGVAAVSGVLLQKGIEYVGKEAGLATGEILLAQLIGPQLAAQIMASASTAVMGVGIALMAYSVGKLLYNAFNALDEAEKQRHILNEINEIIYNLPGEEESAALVDQYCLEAFKDPDPNLPIIESNQKQIVNLISTSSLNQANELSENIWAELQTQIENLPPIKVEELRSALRSNLSLSDRSLGIGAAWKKLLRQTLEMNSERLMATKTRDMMSQMETEVWLETQSNLSAALGAQQNSAQLLIQSVKEKIK